MPPVSATRLRSAVLGILATTLSVAFAAPSAAADSDAAVTPEIKQRKIIILNKGADQPDPQNANDDGMMVERRIEKDGKTIIIKSNKDLSDDEMQKLLAHTDSADPATGARMAAPKCEGVDAGNSEVTASPDATHKAHVRIVTCGDMKTAEGRARHLQGLKAARDNMANSKDISDAARQQIVDGLQQQIDELEKADAASGK